MSHKTILNNWLAPFQETWPFWKGQAAPTTGPRVLVFLLVFLSYSDFMDYMDSVWKVRIRLTV